MLPKIYNTYFSTHILLYSANTNECVFIYILLLLFRIYIFPVNYLVKRLELRKETALYTNKCIIIIIIIK